MTNLEIALGYAARGWAVFPVLGKLPLTACAPHAVHSATKDEVTIRRWWSAYPLAGIAISCGEPSGVFVIDVDAKKDGFETIKAIGLESDTLQVATGGGGLHWYFKYDKETCERLMNRVNGLGKGIDVRTTGGYVVAPPSIHPDTGAAYEWINPGAEVLTAPDLAFKAYDEAEKAAEEKNKTDAEAKRLLGKTKIVQTQRVIDGSPDAFGRAEMYVGDMEIAISGQGGHNKAFRVANALINGFGLQEAQAKEIFRQWSERCQPPWSEKEIAHKIKEAQKEGSYNGREVGCLNRDFTVTEFIEIEDDEKPKAVQQKVGRAIPECIYKPPGLVGQIAKWIDDCAVYPAPLLSVGAALSLVATAMSRRYRTDTGIRPVLYVCGIAETGVGKENARQCIISAMSSIPELKIRIGSDDVSSAAAITTMLREHPVRTLLFDEFGRMLEAYSGKSSASFERQIMTTLIRLWSSGDSVFLGKAKADGVESTPIHNPHLQVYATTTPGSLYRSLKGSDVSDGVLNRLLMIELDHGQEPRKKPSARKTEIPESIKNGLTHIMKGVSVNGRPLTIHQSVELADESEVVEFSGEANKELERITENTRQKLGKGIEHRDLWVRHVEQVIRVALVIAVADDSAQIQESHIKWAEEFVTWCVQTSVRAVTKHMAADKEDAARLAVLAAIETKGEITRSELTKALHRIDRKTRETALQTCIESGDVVEFMVAEGAKKGTKKYRVRQ